MTNCPICSRELDNPNLLRPDFLLCPDCQIAVRVSGTLAKEPDRLGVYNSDWVEAHSHNPIAKDIADSTAGIVRATIGKPPAMILDIGCGSGLLVNKLSNDGYTGFGIDWSIPAIEFAQKNMLGVFTNSDIPDTQQFDAVIASHILEHMEDPHDFLRKVCKALHPYGYLVIAVPNLDWWDPKSVYRSVRKIFDPEHVVGYSPRGLRKVLEANGYEVVRMLTRTHRLAILTAVLITAYRRMRSGKATGEQGTAQRTYSRITDNPIVSRVLSTAMKTVNWWSERGLRGMELIAVARKRE